MKCWSRGFSIHSQILGNAPSNSKHQLDPVPVPAGRTSGHANAMGFKAVSAPRTAASSPKAVNSLASDANVLIFSVPAGDFKHTESIGGESKPLATRQEDESSPVLMAPCGDPKKASAIAHACCAGDAATPPNAAKVTPALTAASLDNASVDSVLARVLHTPAMAFGPCSPPGGFEPGTFRFPNDAKCRWTREYATDTASCATSISLGGTRLPLSDSSIMPSTPAWLVRDTYGHSVRKRANMRTNTHVEVNTNRLK